MPFCLIEAKPVREAVQSSHLADGNASIPAVVNRPRACERPPGRIGAGTERVCDSIGWELEEPGYGLDRPGRGVGKALARNVRMVGTHAGRQQVRVPNATIAEMPAVLV